MRTAKRTQEPTPGPWRVEVEGAGRTIRGPNHKAVVRLDARTTDADAELIVAAPEQQAKIDALAGTLERLAESITYVRCPDCGRSQPVQHDQTIRAHTLHFKPCAGSGKTLRDAFTPLREEKVIP